jgi:hypothetical protein
MEPNASLNSAVPVTQAEPTATTTVAELLEEVPLHSPRRVQRLFEGAEYVQLMFSPEIHVHCDHPKCGGVRRHVKQNEQRFTPDKTNFYFFVDYRCTNCTTSFKVYGLRAERKAAGIVPGVCTKIYQEPPFGQPIPKRLFHVIGESNREHFLQARRAIARGLGIGAHAYYRRIVENTKFELVGSVLEVAQATTASPQQIELLKKAQSETRFSKAIEILRDVSAIPAVLLIDEQNPLALLHDLLSEGIHQLDDRECLERAQEAEVILCEIADRMQVAVTERKAVKAALTSIMKRKKADGEGASVS